LLCLGSLAPKLEVREPMRRVGLSMVGTSPSLRTTQLGFGCSYLLGPWIDRGKSLRLLEAAYDAGIRHFDTARLYGQGECEALLGEFLRRKPDATVATKYGLEPPNLLQRAAMAGARRIHTLDDFAKVLRGDGKAKFHAAGVRASLERSLRALGREQVALFLLHEPERTETRDEKRTRRDREHRRPTEQADDPEQPRRAGAGVWRFRFLRGVVHLVAKVSATFASLANTS